MKVKILSLALLAGLGLTSCDGFIDLKPFSSIDNTVAITNVQNATAAITGVYDNLQSSSYLGREFIVFGEVQTDNILVPTKNSGRFISEANWQLLKSNADVANFWNAAYSTINRANNVINATISINPANQAEETAVVAQIKGEALTIRAMAHFDLVRLFAQNYAFTADGSHPGVPYITKHDPKGQPSRNTVKEVYTNIIKDLNEALTLLTDNNTRISGDGGQRPYIISSDAVRALLARVYLTMGDYTNALKYSKLVIDSGNYTLVANEQYAAGWNNPNTETIFTLAFSNVDYNGTNGLGYIYLENGYGDMTANSALVGIYDNSDVRKGLYVKGAKSGNTANYYCQKYPGVGGVPGLDNIQILRLSEMYLIAAEASANIPGGNDAAQGYYNSIHQRAIKSAPATTLTGDALIAEIKLERRKELAFEGQYFFDLKRWKSSITGARINGTNVIVNYPDDRLAWPIPESEIDANPNIAQNAGY